MDIINLTGVELPPEYEAAIREQLAAFDTVHIMPSPEMNDNSPDKNEYEEHPLPGDRGYSYKPSELRGWHNDPDDKDELVATIDLSGEKMSVFVRYNAEGTADIAVQHEQQPEPTYFSKAEAKLFVAALRSAIDRV